MAKIYISYQHDDKVFVKQLADNLKNFGHTLYYDLNELSPGTEWRSTLDKGLKSSEIFIVIFSKNTEKSNYVLTEVGAARAYALESNRMLLIPVVIDDIPLPVSIQDIQSIVRPDRDLKEISSLIERSISIFIGRRAALESAALAASEKIQNNAAEYIRVAINSLEGRESKDRALSHIWYVIGFTSLLLGIGFSLFWLTNTVQVENLSLASLILAVLKTIVVIGLLGACAKYAFSLGKSYSGGVVEEL